jgi:DNA-binding response OmpR family regulator
MPLRPTTRRVAARPDGFSDRRNPGTTIPRVSNPVLLVYSNRPEIRERIITAIGRRPAPDVGRVDSLECSAVHEVMTATAGRQADVLILDGEAQPTGGIGISRQIHLEAQVIPPVILVVRRADDRWLATWAGADEILVYPLDPVTAAECVAGVLRRRAGGLVTSATGAR